MNSAPAPEGTLLSVVESTKAEIVATSSRPETTFNSCLIYLCSFGYINQPRAVTSAACSEVLSGAAVAERKLDV